MSHCAPLRSHTAYDTDLPSGVWCSKRPVAQFLAAPSPQTCPQTTAHQVNCRRRDWADCIRSCMQIEDCGGVWGCRERLRCFTELLKESTNQIGGWRGRESVAESAESRSLIYRFYFTPSFIHCLSPSLSIPSVLFSPPLIFCYFHRSLPPPGDICFYFCSSVRHNYSNYANSRLSRRLQSNAKRHHKDFSMMS
jgi:hypothetical protein